VPLTMLLLNRLLNVSVSLPWREQASFASAFLSDAVLAEEESLDRALTEP
jgi:hypothetical protein